MREIDMKIPPCSPDLARLYVAIPSNGKVRCKVGISCNPSQRLKCFAASYSFHKPKLIFVSKPFPRKFVYAIEQTLIEILPRDNDVYSIHHILSPMRSREVIALQGTFVANIAKDLIDIAVERYFHGTRS
jgi:hypothetical protein